MRLFILVMASLLSKVSNAALYYPDVQTSLLEHILVDNWGAYASNFSSAITPCTNYVTQTGTAALNSGRTTAAQWMRVLFHDFITANVSAGTGGVDASIGFETARGENSGSAFNDSFTFWRPYVNHAVSMSDLVALGTAMSSNLCGGENIPYRAGRVDSTSAGVTTGVPAPETSLDETLQLFERAGFDQVDAIGLTACGHTMGSVHHGGFPDVVDETAVTPTNTNGGSNFDTTRGVFDPNVVGEYVHWTGNRGGPLVTSTNETTRSDLRLYESDSNHTMRALFAQGNGFLKTCVDLIGRAMNTVPSGVQLSAPINPIPVKPVNVTFDIDAEGKLMLSGRIRILTAAGEAPPASLTLQVSNYSSTLNAEVNTGTSVFGRRENSLGTTSYFAFSVSGVDLRGADSFSIRSSDARAQSFGISSDIFIVPSLATLSGTAVDVTIALLSDRTCKDVTLRIAYPVPQLGTLAPTIKTAQQSVTQVSSSMEGYKMCAGNLLLSNVVTGLVTVSVFIEGHMVDTYLLNGGAAGW